MVLVLIAIGCFLPKNYMVERSKTIPADAATVLTLISDSPTWESWFAWNTAADPDCKWEFPDASTISSVQGP